MNKGVSNEPEGQETQARASWPRMGLRGAWASVVKEMEGETARNKGGLCGIQCKMARA